MAVVIDTQKVKNSQLENGSICSFITFHFGSYKTKTYNQVYVQVLYQHNQALKKVKQIPIYYCQFTEFTLIDIIFMLQIFLIVLFPKLMGRNKLSDKRCDSSTYITMSSKNCNAHIITQLIIFQKNTDENDLNIPRIRQRQLRENKVKAFFNLLVRLDWTDGFYNILGKIHNLGFISCDPHMRTVDTHAHH